MTRMLGLLLLLAVAAHQIPASSTNMCRGKTVTADCKKCVLSKDEQAMFRAHSDACLPQSRVDQQTVDGLLRGEEVDTPELRRHVYCVLLQCKMIGKDGKLQKTALLGKMARGVGRNITKMAESCADHSGDSPEDLAWSLFRCGYDKKTVLFDASQHNDAE